MACRLRRSGRHQQSALAHGQEEKVFKLCLFPFSFGSEHKHPQLLLCAAKPAEDTMAGHGHGHSFRNIRVEPNARAHIGDNYQSGMLALLLDAGLVNLGALISL